eukprot:COSAG01_NODE_2403_length_7757_cov_4.745887_7_plen_177_part_00
MSTAPSTTSAHRGVPRWPPPTSAAARGATACQCVIYTQASAHARFRPRAHRRTHVVESLLLWLAPLTQQRRRWCVCAALCVRPPCCVCAVGAATLGGRVQWGARGRCPSAAPRSATHPATPSRSRARRGVLRTCQGHSSRARMESSVSRGASLVRPTVRPSPARYSWVSWGLLLAA